MTENVYKLMLFLGGAITFQTIFKIFLIFLKALYTKLLNVTRAPVELPGTPPYLYLRRTARKSHAQRQGRRWQHQGCGMQVRWLPEPGRGKLCKGLGTAAVEMLPAAPKNCEWRSKVGKPYRAIRSLAPGP